MLLEVADVYAGYDSGGDILRGATLAVRAGEFVCLVGPNGAGKSTVLRVISGLLKPRHGKVTYRGRDISGLRPDLVLRLGIAHIPQGRSVFPGMTVWENVLLGGYSLRDRKLVAERLERVCALFPLVPERRHEKAGRLSGGQQKQVEIARALMLAPDVLLLDEPSLGLDPKTTRSLFASINELHQAGMTILMVEQNARTGLEAADRGYVLELGRTCLEGEGRRLLEDPEMKRLYLGQGLVA